MIKWVRDVVREIQLETNTPCLQFNEGYYYGPPNWSQKLRIIFRILYYNVEYPILKIKRGDT